MQAAYSGDSNNTVSFGIAKLTIKPPNVKAQISANMTSCSAQAPASCVVLLVNSGNDSATVNSCTLTLVGNTIGNIAGTVFPANPLIPRESSVQVSCIMGAGVSASPGSGVIGYFVMDDGEIVVFLGIWN
jgi:hypothetical protein